MLNYFNSVAKKFCDVRSEELFIYHSSPTYPEDPENYIQVSLAIVIV